MLCIYRMEAATARLMLEKGEAEVDFLALERDAKFKKWAMTKSMRDKAFEVSLYEEIMFPL